MSERIRKAALAVLKDAGYNKAYDPKGLKGPPDGLIVSGNALYRLHEAAKAEPKAAKLPLTAGQVKRMTGSNCFISVVVPLSLDELGVDKDCLNDAVSRMVLDDDSGLEDISYDAVGIDKDGNVLVRVTGDVENWLARQEV